MKNMLTIKAFAEWCEKQPADKLFDGYNPSECAVGQYAKSLGFVGSTGGFKINIGGYKGVAIHGLDPLDITEFIRERRLQTFGALASRLHAFTPSVGRLA